MRGNTSRNASPTSRVKAKSGVGVAGEVVVEEDAAGAARLVAVRQEEVAVAPGLERGIIFRVVPVAGGLERGVEIGRVRHRLGRLRPHRRQVAAAAEPALRGHQHPRVEMRRRHARAAHVRDQADAAGPEARVLRGAGDLAAELRAELAPHGGDVHADLLEHRARASRSSPRRRRLRASGVGRGPRGADEAARPAEPGGVVRARASSSIASNAAHSRSRRSSNQARAASCSLACGGGAGSVIRADLSGLRGLFHAAGRGSPSGAACCGAKSRASD